MSLLVALHSPAIGYCVTSESYFLGDHAPEVDTCEHHCDDHQHLPETGGPVEHEHLLVSLDAGDFQWAATSLLMVPRFSEIELPDWSVPALFTFREDGGIVDSPAIPPPPDVPIFRRDAALRI